MRSPFSQGVNISLLLCLFAVTSPPALAEETSSDCPKKPGSAEAARKLAGTWFAKGEDLVDKQRDHVALAAFLCSLEMVEHPATLFNAGQAARLVGKHEQALKHLRRYLALAPEGPMSGRAKKLILEIEATSEAEPGLQAMQKPPDKGQEQVGGDNGSVKYRVAEDKRRKLLTAGYVSLGVGVAGVITGTVLQVMAGRTALSDAAETDDYEEYKRLEDASRGYQIGAVVGFAVGGVALAAGLTMVLVANKKEKKPGSGATITFLPGPGSVSITGRF